MLRRFTLYIRDVTKSWNAVPASVRLTVPVPVIVPVPVPPAPVPELPHEIPQQNDPEEGTVIDCASYAVMAEKNMRNDAYPVSNQTPHIRKRRRNETKRSRRTKVGRRWARIASPRLIRGRFGWERLDVGSGFRVMELVTFRGKVKYH